MKHKSRWMMKAALASMILVVGCGDEKSERAAAALRVEDVASYWSVKGADAENNNYIRPVIRFRLVNDFDEPVGYAQAMAVFRRESFPDEYWGSDYLYEVTEEPLAPGDRSGLVTLRSDANFVSKDPPERMFDNEKWEQVVVEVFVRVGPSSWTSAAKLEIEKQLGAPGVEKFLNPPPESGTPATEDVGTKS